MKRILFLAVVALCAMTSCSTYNGMVEKEEAVDTAWADVEAQYQRRADLIPNLVATVKGYAAHEKSTLEAVVEARAAATSVHFSAENLTAADIEAYSKAQAGVTSALGRLLAVAENYPELKANESFMELQAQIEGTENRISVARTRFNDATRAYNVATRRFPANIIAGMFGFGQKPYFAADEASAAAPAVEF